jgi:hypothetical protein
MASKRKLGQAAFETFAKLHPHEAAELDWEQFLAFVQREKPGIIDIEVKLALEETKDEPRPAPRRG